MKTLSLVSAAILVLCGAVSAFGAGLGLREVKSPHGVTIALLPSDIQGQVAIALAFPCGMSCDKGKDYAAGLIAPGLALEGAGGKSAAELFEAFRDTGGSFDFSANSDQTYLSLSAPRRGIDGAVGIANTVMTQPDFPAKALERRKQRLAVTIQENQLDTDHKAYIAFVNANVRAPSYDSYFDPSAQDLLAVDVAQLKQWMARHLVTDNILVSVVGDIDDEAAGILVDKLLTGLPPRSDLRINPDITFKTPVAEPQFVPGDGGKQAVVNFGMIGTRPATLEEWYGGMMLAHIFGDGQKSRMFTQVREATGQTYGLESDFNFFELLGMNRVKGRVGITDLGKTLATMRQAWEDFRRDGPTEAEIIEARSQAFRELENNFRNHLKTAQTLRDYLTGHWSVADLNRIPEVIAGVDLHDKAMREKFFTAVPSMIVTQ